MDDRQDATILSGTKLGGEARPEGVRARDGAQQAFINKTIFLMPWEQ